MIEKNKCTTCKHVYEVSWDDDTDTYCNDDDSWETDESYEDELYPEYCPFCGIHREYDDTDLLDEFDDK